MPDAHALSRDAVVAVIGGGAMGAGIAYVAAASGHPVIIHDLVEGIAERARASVLERFAKALHDGRIGRDVVDTAESRVRVAGRLEDMGSTALVIEAVVEDLGVKQDLFRRLEDLVPGTTILATNTSSISITAIGSALRDPSRLAGFHFFNPAHAMKLVEVVHGLATAPEVVTTLKATAENWGKVAVVARSTPGFIVNRVARAFYGEPLRLLEEGVADVATIDRLMTGSGGFRMGPFALMDLIGNDVNHAVTTSIYEAFHHEPRFRPSILQREMVQAGWLGRKSGKGFYDHAGGTSPVTPTTRPGTSPWSLPSELDGTRIALTDGRTAGDRARDDRRPTVVHDLIGEGAECIGLAASAGVPEATLGALARSISATGRTAIRLPDWPGLVVMRTVAMLINEAYEAELTGVASASDIDRAVVKGLNYPMGPFAWSAFVGSGHALAVLDHLHAATGDPRYRASFGLRRRAGA